MPGKRKSHIAAANDSPRKRRASNGPLVETQPPSTPPRPTGRRTRASLISRPDDKPEKARVKANDSNIDRSSLKENDIEGKDQSSDDGVPLSPTRTRQTHNSTNKSSQLVVEITRTPRRPSRLLLRTMEQESDDSDEDVLPVFLAKQSAPSAAKSLIKGTISRVSVANPKTRLASKANLSPSRPPRDLADHLHSCVNVQRRAILRILNDLPEMNNADLDEDEDLSTNTIAFGQLCDLLQGTVERNEGNSCLLLGPRGSGKSRLLERCITSLPNDPIVIRLSAWVQHNDRLAMREIARQLFQQTGSHFLSSIEDEPEPENEKNPFLDRDVDVSPPPPAHLPALISVLPTLSRPVIVVLDGFDLFALHARQLLLYCLLDTVQTSRADQGDKGVAVIGMTTRIDTINLLEKRVKSRFSGRMLRTAPSKNVGDWIALARAALCVDADEEDNVEWKSMWTASVEKFLCDPAVANAMVETFELSREVRMLSRLLTATVLQLSPSSPFPTFGLLQVAIERQRSRPKHAFLHSIPYPGICLLIAAMHSQTAGHDIITFQMLHDRFYTQVRASTSAPVQVDGGSIGMVKCTREVLMSAFEQLVLRKVFVGVTPSSTAVAKEFMRYRCSVSREEVREAVELMGKTNLKKWFTKAPDRDEFDFQLMLKPITSLNNVITYWDHSITKP